MVMEDVPLIHRRSAGAVAWVVTIIFLPIQAVVAMKWPRGYSLTTNAISDLGITTCGPVRDGDLPVREACSPWHSVFNGGLIASGTLMVVGAVLLHGWWTGRLGRAGTALMALAGVSVVVVGLAPWDLNPDLHDLAATSQALVQWLAMILLAKAAGPGRFRQVSVATVGVSVASFIAFALALAGSEVPFLPLGIAERLSFDALTLWTAFAGIAVLVNRSKAGQDVERRISERSEVHAPSASGHSP